MRQRPVLGKLLDRMDKSLEESQRIFSTAASGENQLNLFPGLFHV